MKRFAIAAMGTCFLFAAASWAQADTIALQSFSPGLEATSGSDQLYGREFTVTSPVVVTALGVGDSTGNPLSVSHDVGIFSVSSHSLLASTTVPAGNSATLDAGFRYVGLGNALTLTSGQYVIEMTMPANNTDFQSILTSNVVTASQIQYVTSEFPVVVRAWRTQPLRDCFYRVCSVQTSSSQVPRPFPNRQLLPCWPSVELA